MKYVAYYRVSKESQGESGLGLSAQATAVEKLAGTSGILAGFTEVESGSKNNRAELKLAMKFALDNNATLIIAKLDRLSRNTLFIAQLQHSGVKFVCADMPNANNLTISVLAAVAENELVNVSNRTSAALQVLISKGIKLGTPANLTDKARANSIISRRKTAVDNVNNKRAYAFIKAMSGKTLTFIANALNEGSFETSTGGSFSAKQVSRVRDLYCV